MNAIAVPRILRLGSYQPAWAISHRFLAVMVVWGWGRLWGTVEMIETFIGGAWRGKRGRGADGKMIVFRTIERATRIVCARVQTAPHARIDALCGFITANIAAGSTVFSDALTGYSAALAFATSR